MNSTAHTTNTHFPTLFVLIAGVLIYRVADLFSTKQKLEQLASRTAWENNKRLSFSMIRGIARNTRNVNAVLLRFKILMLVREDFLLYLAFLILFVFTSLGVAVWLSDDIRNGGNASASFIVAIIAAIVSFAASVLNLIVENVRIYL